MLCCFSGLPACRPWRRKQPNPASLPSPCLLFTCSAQATNLLLGKVAVQALGPAVLYLGLGLLLLNSGGFVGRRQAGRCTLLLARRGSRAPRVRRQPEKRACLMLPRLPPPPAALRPAAPGSPEAETQAAVRSCVGFLAAWAGACWFAYGAGILWMFRTGMLQP